MDTCPTSLTSTHTLKAPYSPWASPCSLPSPPLLPPRWCCSCSESPADACGSSFGAPTVWFYPSHASASEGAQTKAPSPWLWPCQTWTRVLAGTRICHIQTPPARRPVVQTAPVCGSTPWADPRSWRGSSRTSETWREKRRNQEITCCLWRETKCLLLHYYNMLSIY